MYGFWQFVQWVQHLPTYYTCVASYVTPDKQTIVTYGGNCLEAFKVALQQGITWGFWGN